MRARWALAQRRLGTVCFYSMPNLRLPFECPICGSDGFRQVEVKGRDGVSRLTQAYECKGCSTMFRERDRFTKHRVQVIGADGRDLKPAAGNRKDS
jgi:transposase-like protein